MTTKHTTAEKDEKMAAETAKSEARAAEAAAAPPAEVAPAVAPNDLAAANVPEEASDVETVGNPDAAWSVVAKASSEKGGWTKVTRRMAVSNGAIYQTETQQRNPDGSFALSQATVFVPA